MNIKIDPQIKEKTPDFCIGVLSFDVKQTEATSLDDKISEQEQEIANTYTLKSLLETPKIKAARDAYKAYGKDPSRYRLAVESLFRRIIKGHKLYRISPLVDLGNYLSLRFQKSTALLDYNQIKGDVLIRLGIDEPYVGIARGEINVKNIPVYVDSLGPFGSTTSDTPRTMITEHTRSAILFIISFTGKEELIEELSIAKDLLKTTMDVTSITSDIID